ncbi:hypothetical protein BS50DRAFT_602111 [Corynespora cassiicola Philippines]|uniref:Uncharacterized protein n=1 Tax=Corynespora cassiicola Philippines TaxID=1448308 RepID=A0A2T2NGA2_CORCC|nr:hypothetical protein BS50DRAFT_602111 [Corynespora cassiicola Philippines]
MQRYMLLSSQQEVLRRRLSLHVPCAAPMTAASPEFQSLSSSPTSGGTYLPYPTNTNPIPVQPGMGHRHSIDDPHIEDSHRLCEINQQLKATLTELLNTDSVRADGKYRAWVQGRLMDAEQQIRREKRRRSSGSNEEREIATSIAEHLDLGIHSSKTWG